jgi:hypothetical protein
MAPEIQLGMAVAEASGFASPNTQVGGSGSALLVPNFQFTDVPEPASASLLLLCGLVMGWRKRVNSKW